MKNTHLQHHCNTISKQFFENDCGSLIDVSSTVFPSHVQYKYRTSHFNWIFTNFLVNHTNDVQNTVFVQIDELMYAANTISQLRKACLRLDTFNQAIFLTQLHIIKKALNNSAK